MIIRKDQTDAFKQQMTQSFESRMITHLNQAFPAKAQGLGDAKLREEIQYGTTRAKQYNIESERDVASFINLMFLVRRDFDTSPETPWARPILTDKSSNAENRLRRLGVAAQRHLNAARRRT